LTDSDDYIFIITALKGLYSALNDSKIDKTLEKLLNISPSQTAGKQTVFLDFSVLGEKTNVSEYIRLVKHAIEKKSVIEFEYTDADSHLTHRLVEPVALTYKWYNWYVFAFCRTKEDYRLFKLSRITSLTSTRIHFSKVHGNPEELMNKHDSMNAVRYFDVKLLCKASIRVAVLEYLNGRIAKELDNGDFILELHVPENERMWFSLLLSFGNEVKVLEPSTLKDRLVEKSKETIDLYLVNSDI
jgi:predicted DNA-binding transcriptional regulator YafY